MTNTMIAWLTAPSTLHRTELPIPTPAPDQLLVRTRAAAFNNADLSEYPDNQLAGPEISGDVIAVGDSTDPMMIGRRVAGPTGDGAFAEYVLVHRRHVLRIPDEISYTTAAALPVALLTEHGALRAGEFIRGNTVLSTAATSAIALVGVQVARELGASQVIGTTRTASRRQLLQRVGTDTVIVTDERDLRDAVDAATGGHGADIILDHVGGDTLGKALTAAGQGARAVNIGRLSGSAAEIDLTTLASRGITLRAVSYGFSDPEAIGQLLDGVTKDLMTGVAAERIRPVISQVFAFDQAPEAFEHLARGDANGKVVLTFD